MITGIGVDIVQITRIAKVIQRKQNALYNRILHSNELIKLNTINHNKQVNFIAKRFAAKEALAKALGSGIGRPFAFKDIEINNNSDGKPYVIIHHEAWQNDKHINISLADDFPQAIAFVVIS